YIVPSLDEGSNPSDSTTQRKPLVYNERFFFVAIKRASGCWMSGSATKNASEANASFVLLSPSGMAAGRVRTPPVAQPIPPTPPHKGTRTTGRVLSVFKRRPTLLGQARQPKNSREGRTE